MTVELKPEQERRIEQLMRSGRFHSLDELLDQALEKVATGEPSPDAAQEERKRRAKNAVVGIRELRKGLSLGGLRIKDLIEEGRT
jgi:Arc/MetJ-type ribon-helix-helix transcriptional regulator